MPQVNQTPEREELRSCCAGLVCTCTPSSPQDDEYIPPQDEPTGTDRIVAYRDPNVARVLLCREHGKRYVGMVPVTAEELPDGGICTFGRLSSLECGRDVLIDAPKSGGAS